LRRPRQFGARNRAAASASPTPLTLSRLRESNAVKCPATHKGLGAVICRQLPVNKANHGTLEQMTKQQLVEAVSEKTGHSRTEVEATIDSILGTITEALSSNERVDVRGFGSFVVKEKKERQGRNPRTGETITIPAKRDVGFKAGKELGERLAQSKPEITPLEPIAQS